MKIHKSDYFKDLYIKKITICTEDQVSETNPLAYGDDFIYQETYEPNAEAQVVPLTKKVIELSEKQLLNSLNAAGGIMGHRSVNTPLPGLYFRSPGPLNARRQENYKP